VRTSRCTYSRSIICQIHNVKSKTRRYIPQSERGCILCPSAIDRLRKTPHVAVRLLEAILITAHASTQEPILHALQGSIRTSKRGVIRRGRDHQWISSHHDTSACRAPMQGRARGCRAKVPKRDDADYTHPPPTIHGWIVKTTLPLPGRPGGLSVTSECVRIECWVGFGWMIVWRSCFLSLLVCLAGT
jgi:hypothetical protein